MNKASYIFSLDVIRVLAIIGVVSIHIVNAVYTRPDFFGGATWWAAILIDSLSRVSIPLFILMSGYLILGKSESLPLSLKRILFRILIPLIFWTGFFVWYGGGFPSFLHFNSGFVPKIFYGNLYHLYYLVIIIGLYFVAPLIRALLQATDKKTQNYFVKFLIFLGITQIALQFIFQACGTENFFTKWVPYTGLFVAGCVLGNKAHKFTTQKLLLLYSLGLALTLGGNYIQYLFLTKSINVLESAGCLSHYTDHYLSVNVVVMSLSAFLLLFNLKYQALKKNVLTSKLVHSVATASFGIYVIHPFVARFLEVQFHLAVDFSSLPIPVIIFSRLFIVLVFSYIITIALSKIPIVKYVMGVKTEKRDS